MKYLQLNPSLFYIILICFIFSFASSSRYSELKKEFKKYGDCLERNTKNLKNEPYIQVIHAVRTQDVILPCFTCVSPEDGREIETTYKPSAGMVGRAFRAVVDFFKNKFLQSTRTPADPNRWKYDWEFAMMSRNFMPLSSMHFSAASSISDRIRRFISKDDAEFVLGDRYELVLKNVDKNSTGYYRCINRNSRNVISNMYFLEVSNQKNIKSVKGEVDENRIPKSISLKKGIIKEHNIRYDIKASSWSKCSYCGSDRGEQTRSISCQIRPNVPVEKLAPSLRYLKLFDKIGCASSLVPIGIRRKMKSMGNDVIYVQHRKCYEECETLEQMKADINSTEKLGELRTLDYLPAGEFLFGDLLPRLLPPVTRKVQLITDGDPLVLVCQKIIDLDSGVHWYSLKNGPIMHKNIDNLYGTDAYFDEQDNLIFDRFVFEYDDEYFCYSSNNILLGTFHIRVIDNDKSHETIELVRIIIKFAVFVLIFTLIVKQLF